MKYDRPY